MVEIIEHYTDWRPPKRVPATVARLLAEIPEAYLRGLHSVVLTTAADLSSRQKRGSRRNTKEGTKIVLGRYFAARRGRQARIELYLDHIEERWRPCLLKAPFLCDIVVGRVLWHEVGHHVHRVMKPEHRNGEAVAEDWTKVLGRRYLDKRFGFLVRPLRLLSRVLSPLLPKRSTK